MMSLQISRHAFRTQPALVDRKIIARLEADELAFFDQQIHSALHAAIRAVRRHNLINHAVSLPAAVGRVVQVRTESLDDVF